MDHILSLAKEEYSYNGFPSLLSSLLTSVKEIGAVLREGSVSNDKVGTTNAFGDHQLHIDVKCDEIIFNNLRESGACFVASSEESPIEEKMGGKGFSVAFDPLDGSSIIGANFAVGTIVGIYEGETFLNRKGSDQCCSFFALYGPRVTIALALNDFMTKNRKKIAIELTLINKEWAVTMKDMQIAPKAKTFAPGNLRATFDNKKYQDLVQYWIENRYTLRYSGGLVPDVFHILSKGEGVLSNASSLTSKAKLRLLYELFPIALVIEAANGLSLISSCEAMASIEPVSLLDVVLTDLDKRSGCCFGSKDEVERFKTYIFDSSVCN